MQHLSTALELFLRLSVFTFPIIAVWTARRPGARQLKTLAMLALIVIVGFALLMSSRTFGNRRDEATSYVKVATNVTVLFVMMFGPSVVAAAVTATFVTRRKWSAGASYLTTVGVSIVTWGLAMVLAVGVMYGIMR
jgi:hypothetical protein